MNTLARIFVALVALVCVTNIHSADVVTRQKDSDDLPKSNVLILDTRDAVELARRQVESVLAATTVPGLTPPSDYQDSCQVILVKLV